MTEQERDELIVQTAAERYEDAGRIEIDAGAAISEGSDNGAFVQAWVWVDFAGTVLDKESQQ